MALVRKLVGRATNIVRSAAAIHGALSAGGGSNTPAVKPKKEKAVRAHVEKAVNAQIVRPKKPKKSKPKTAYKTPRGKVPGLKPKPGTKPTPTNAPF